MQFHELIEPQIEKANTVYCECIYMYMHAQCYCCRTCKVTSELLTFSPFLLFPSTPPSPVQPSLSLVLWQQRARLGSSINGWGWLFRREWQAQFLVSDACGVGPGRGRGGGACYSKRGVAELGTAMYNICYNEHCTSLFYISMGGLLATGGVGS